MKPEFVETTKLSNEVAIVIAKEGTIYRFGYCDKSSGNYEFWGGFTTPDLKVATKAYQKEVKHQTW